MLDRRTRLAVLVGGMLGTALRMLVSALVPTGELGGADLPSGTLAANLTGALVLGFVVARVPDRRRDEIYVGLTTGLLGAYTTFSALAVEVRELAPEAPLVALGYAVVSGVAGVAVARLGCLAGDRRRRSRQEVDA